MLMLESFARAIPLPAAPDGWFDYRYSPLSDGRLAIVRTRADIHRAHHDWWEEVSGGNERLPIPDLWGTDLLISVFDGNTEIDVGVMPSSRYPLVDQFPDGRWIIAAARADEGEHNGRIYAANGAFERAIPLSEGIQDLLCSDDGTLWVSYFDEGVFGGPSKDGSWPTSSGGIVQFDAMGKPLWAFNNQRSGHMIDDAYAMTLAHGDVWTCFYSDFPIARVKDGVITFWPNDIGGASAIAVENDLIVLAGGYGDEANRIAIVKLENGTSHTLGSLRHSLSTAPTPKLSQGCGNLLHVVQDGMWMTVTVSDVARAIGSEQVSSAPA